MIAHTVAVLGVALAFYFLGYAFGHADGFAQGVNAGFCKAIIAHAKAATQALLASSNSNTGDSDGSAKG